MCSSVWAVDTSRGGGDVILPAESPLAGSLGTEGGRVGGWGGGGLHTPWCCWSGGGVHGGALVEGMVRDGRSLCGLGWWVWHLLSVYTA